MKPTSGKKPPKPSFAQNVRDTFLGLAGKIPPTPPEEVARLLKRGAVLLDVRTGIEKRKNPVPGAINIPILKLKDHLDELPAGKTFVAFCLRGGRAERARKMLEANGIKAVNGGGYKAILKIVDGR
jgi:rhodanese-related sulfurtransferase